MCGRGRKVTKLVRITGTDVWEGGGGGYVGDEVRQKGKQLHVSQAIATPGVLCYSFRSSLILGVRISLYAHLLLC